MNGSIEKRGESSYRLIVSGGYDSQGKRIRHRRTVQVEGKTEGSRRKNAEKELAKFIAEIERGEYYGSGKMTLKQFAEQWMEKYAWRELAPKTAYRYKELLEYRIIPEMGHRKMDEVKPMHLLDFYEKLQQDGARKDGKPGGLSPQSIKHHHKVIRSMYNTAIRWQLVNHNPAEKIGSPRIPKADIAAYDEEQTAQLLSALTQEPLKFQALVMTALTTGCRRGELLGLEWEDIDFDNTTITIKQSLQYVPSRELIFKEPKNETSKRTIPATASTMELLKKHKAEQGQQRLKLGDKWHDNGLVFTTWDGNPMHPDTPSSWFRDFTKKHNLPHLTFHGLRHTAATLLIEKGVKDLTVSALLGHSDPHTTKKIYAKSLKCAERAAADTMESIIGGSKNAK